MVKLSAQTLWMWTVVVIIEIKPKRNNKKELFTYVEKYCSRMASDLWIVIDFNIIVALQSFDAIQASTHSSTWRETFSSSPILSAAAKILANPSNTTKMILGVASSKVHSGAMAPNWHNKAICSTLPPEMNKKYHLKINKTPVKMK